MQVEMTKTYMADTSLLQDKYPIHDEDECNETFQTVQPEAVFAELSRKGTEVGDPCTKSVCSGPSVSQDECDPFFGSVGQEPECHQLDEIIKLVEEPGFSSTECCPEVCLDQSADSIDLKNFSAESLMSAIDEPMCLTNSPQEQTLGLVSILEDTASDTKSFSVYGEHLACHQNNEDAFEFEKNYNKQALDGDFKASHSVKQNSQLENECIPLVLQQFETSSPTTISAPTTPEPDFQTHPKVEKKVRLTCPGPESCIDSTCSESFSAVSLATGKTFSLAETSLMSAVQSSDETLDLLPQLAISSPPYPEYCTSYGSNIDSSSSTNQGIKVARLSRKSEAHDTYSEVPVSTGRQIRQQSLAGEKLRVMREKNKVAARKSRKKRKDEEMRLVKEIDCEECKTTELNYTINQLQRELLQLKKLFNTHSCNLNAPV